MNKLICICLISTCLITACITQDSSFHKKIFADFNSRNSFYLSVRIASTSYKGFAVIEISDLVLFFSKKYNINAEKSLDKVRSVLLKKEIIYVDVNDFEDYRFRRVTDDSNVLSNASKGKRNFINTYFHANLVIKNGLSEKEMVCIIHQLFKWEIATKKDCESGYLYIDSELNK